VGGEVSEATPSIFRAPMRSRVVQACPGAGAEYAIGRGVVGIGEAVERRPASVAEAVLAVAQAHGERAGRLLARFAALPDGSFVWTRERDGTFRLGRISGVWRYDDSPAAHQVGIHHVRRTVWSPRRFADGDVPAAVARTFARGGRNLQRTHDREAERQSVDYWSAGCRSDTVSAEQSLSGARAGCVLQPSQRAPAQQP
jgi:hypothetical protein